MLVPSAATALTATPAVPVEPSRRARVLADTGLLDSPPEDSFDALVQSAAAIARCPIAAVSLLEEHRQWFKARVGIPVAELPRHIGLCHWVVADEAPVIIADTQQDDRSRDAPLVTAGIHARFYAGFPIHVEGLVLGTLLVIDLRPRRLDETQRRSLARLAQAAAELIALRRHARHAAHERQRLLDFARASGDWMFELDAQLRFRALEGDVERLTGARPADLLGHTIDDALLLDARGRPIAGDRLHGLLARRVPLARALVQQSTPRGTLTLSYSALPVFDAQGAFEGFRGTAREVTAPIAAAARQSERDEVLAKLSMQVPGVLFQLRQSTDGRWRYAYLSAHADEVYGVDGLGDGPLSEPMPRLHPEDRAAFMKSVSTSATRLTPWQCEYRIVRDADVRWLETRASPERLADGGTLWHGFTSDVTARKEIELAMQRTEARWAVAAEAAGLGVLAIDLRRHQAQLDERASELHGLPWPHAPLSDAAWLESISPDDRAAAAAAVQRSIDTQTTLRLRVRVDPAPEGERWLEIVADPTYDSALQPLDLIGTVRDVTEPVQRDALQRDKVAAEQANQSKTEFLSRVSHELRTPLNGVLGFAQLMALDEDQPLGSAQRQRLAHVQRAGQHLLELIDDVLDLTRIEQRGQVFEAVTVDAAASLQHVLTMIGPLAHRHGVQLPAAPTEPVWVLADPRALGQVLMNLVSNAIKYNREGRAVEVRLRHEDDRLHIDVRDEGEGLTPLQQAGLFQPFNRLGAERRRIEGTGLGLVIARDLAHGMGGALSVQSTPMQGSTFTLSLPAAPAPPPTPVGPADPAPGEERSSGPRPARVLYIEDEPLNVLLLQEVIRTRSHWTLDVARDAATGLIYARGNLPDLVLIDMNLPDMSGAKLIEALRSDPLTAGLRCIALSADAMREQIDAARAAGFDDYWTKPIDVTRLLAQLESLMASPPPGSPTGPHS